MADVGRFWLPKRRSRTKWDGGRHSSFDVAVHMIPFNLFIPLISVPFHFKQRTREKCDIVTDICM